MKDHCIYSEERKGGKAVRMGRSVQVICRKKQSQMGNIFSGDLVNHPFSRRVEALICSIASFLGVNTPSMVDFMILPT